MQLPDNTWRVIGLAITSIPTYNTVWGRMSWLAQDPNVEIDEVLPCHDTDGNWNPGPSCGGFPTTPGSGDGVWHLSPACADPSPGGRSQTCTMLQLGPSTQLVTPQPEPAEPAEGIAGDVNAGCSLGTGGVGILFILLPLMVRRQGDA